MHYHMVMFRFPDEVEDRVVEQVISLFDSLREIPAVKSLVVGPNLLTRKSDDWTHAALMSFESMEVMFEQFGPHPIHQHVWEATTSEFADYIGVDIAD